MGLTGLGDASSALHSGLCSVVKGHDQAVRDLIVALFAGGHVLLEGPPGLGKTLLVKTLARLVRAQFQRIQFTPDLMPADVTGTTVFRPQTAELHFVPGPIFTQILLADEINRTPPKTQAALLEAMQERQVTIDGQTRSLPEPFFVAATQNPVEYEGTYPLPEAQIDRFFMKISLGYPDPAAEREILDAHAGGIEFVPAGAQSAVPVLDAARLLELRQEAAGVFVDPAVRDYIVRLCGATRAHRRVALGASTRAAVALLFAAKVAAACETRDFARPDDVKAMAPAVLRHRLILRAEAEVEGYGPDRVVSDLLGSVEVPRGTDTVEGA